MSSPIHFIPYSMNPLAELAERVLSDHADALPRLETARILLPESQAASRLRQQLLAQAATRGHSALLGPQILGWRQWLQGFNQGLPALASDQRRELILVEALRQYPNLYGEGNLWALADSLLSLFDELGCEQIQLPEAPQVFLQRLEKGYGLGKRHPALEREAELVHTLWHAWHRELHERGLVDRHNRHLLQLSASLQQPLQVNCYLLAPLKLSIAEHQWLTRISEQPGVHLLIQGQASHYACQREYHPQHPLQLLSTALAQSLPEAPADPYSRLLDTIFDADATQDNPLATRARDFAQAHPHSPAQERLTLFAANSGEEEAQAISLQVRRWLLAGHTRIGIVTENRRLARRVRALLERAGISLQDAAGWALSTTSAAAVVERWLQCVEEDFPHVALLDLLKSPLVFATQDRQGHLNTVYRLQHDLIEHEQIGSGLQRYQHHLSLRQKRLPAPLAEELQGLAQLLQQLEQAAAPLIPLRTSGPLPASRLLGGLLDSLQALDLLDSLAQDAAGQRLLDEIQQMQQAAEQEAIEMDWLAFRSWLGRTWERFHFQPPSSGLGVELMGLGQTALAHFDGLIIAGMEREFLPGGSAGTPFFNDAVRQELGLPGADSQMSHRFADFRRLLEAAPRILLSYRQQEGDETITPSPWLEAIRAFHQLGWGHGCEDTGLAPLLQDPAVQVVQTHEPAPQPVPMPTPSLPAEMLPRRYSSSAYQLLLNCPYQFFAARGLRLAPPEEIRESLEKSDFGERVHECLQAFHSPVEGLPEPFTGPLDEKRRDQAIERMMQISEAVFATDLEDNFLHRGWLQRWQASIPAYIDWQMAHAEQWQVQSVEQQAVCALTEQLGLHGRLDRIDSDGEHLAIIDYKTGNVPKRDEVESGEAIQLPFYALLKQDTSLPVAEVSYLGIDQKSGVRQPLRLEDKTLHSLSSAIATRLIELDAAMQAGAGLPAWGDEKTCEYCPMDGLCRRAMWGQ